VVLQTPVDTYTAGLGLIPEAELHQGLLKEAGVSCEWRKQLLSATRKASSDGPNFQKREALV